MIRSRKNLIDDIQLNLVLSRLIDPMLDAGVILDMSSVSLGDTVSQHLIDDIQFNLVLSRLSDPMLNASVISDMSSVSLGDTGCDFKFIASSFIWFHQGLPILCSMLLVSYQTCYQ